MNIRSPVKDSLFITSFWRATIPALMCGRFSIAIEPRVLEERFGAIFSEPMAARYNAAPSQRLPVIINSDQRHIVMAHWGLTPPWFSKAKGRDGIINVRAETLREKRTFEDDLRHRRCLVLADGFYEWKNMPSGMKVPYRITLKDGAPFAFAGIWETGADEETPDSQRFAIVTTTPNSLMESIHNRMPVILKPDQEQLWLSDAHPDSELVSILRPFESRLLRAFEVSRLVNKASVDSPELIKPQRNAMAA